MDIVTAGGLLIGFVLLVVFLLAGVLVPFADGLSHRRHRTH
jgi:hypothetical protein